MIRVSLLLTLGLAGTAIAAEQLDAQSLQPGTRATAGAVELVAQFAPIAALDTVGDQYLASGYVGQIANQAPSLGDPGQQVLARNSSAAIALAATDHDGDQIVFEIIAAPSHGSLSGSGPEFTYTPQADFKGSDSFQVQVHDGGDRSPILTVILQVGGDRRILIRIQPDPAALLEVEAQAVDESGSVRVDYVAGTGAIFPELDSDRSQRLVWIFGGNG